MLQKRRLSLWIYGWSGKIQWNIWWWLEGLVTGWIPPLTFLYCSLVYFTSQPFVLKVWSRMFVLVSVKTMDFHGHPYCFPIYISLYPIWFLIQRLWCKKNKRTIKESWRGDSISYQFLQSSSGALSTSLAVAIWMNCPFGPK